MLSGGVSFINFGALVMEVDLAKVGEPKPQSAQLMVFFIVKNDLIDLLKVNVDRFRQNLHS